MSDFRVLEGATNRKVFVSLARHWLRGQKKRDAEAIAKEITAGAICRWSPLGRDRQVESGATLDDLYSAKPSYVMTADDVSDVRWLATLRFWLATDQFRMHVFMSLNELIVAGERERRLREERP